MNAELVQFVQLYKEKRLCGGRYARGWQLYLGFKSGFLVCCMYIPYIKNTYAYFKIQINFYCFMQCALKFCSWGCVVDFCIAILIGSVVF